MESSNVQASETQTQEREPWQLQMFRKSLKKQQKLRALLKMVDFSQDRRCLLVTCGDNNGALNWHFKQAGGEWSWVDAEEDSLAQIRAVTGDPVQRMDKEAPSLPFPDETFDMVMTIDVHEHLNNPKAVNEELARVVRTGGKVIVTTPNGDETKTVVRLKHLIGMRPEDYGHIVVGFDVPDLEKQLEGVGLAPYAHSSYARFFTELLELVINFAYVKVLSKRSEAKVEKGQIAPQNQDQIKSVEKQYKLYSLIYPFFWAFSQLDALVGFRRGYAVIVAARKER